MDNEELLGALLGADDDDDDFELEGLDEEDFEELSGYNPEIGSLFSRLKKAVKKTARAVRHPISTMKSGFGLRRGGGGGGGAGRAFVDRRQLMASARVADRSPLLSATGLRPDSVGKKYIGTGIISWTNATGAVVQAIEIEPQIPFRTYRILASFERIGAAGTAILTSVPTLESLVIGVKNQAAAPGAVPLACFAPNAWGVDLSLDSADRGTTLTLQVGLNVAPGVGEAVILGIMLTGVTVG